jgi:hypothetical protein
MRLGAPRPRTPRRTAPRTRGSHTCASHPAARSMASQAGLRRAPLPLAPAGAADHSTARRQLPPLAAGAPRTRAPRHGDSAHHRMRTACRAAHQRLSAAGTGTRAAAHSETRQRGAAGARSGFARRRKGTDKPDVPQVVVGGRERRAEAGHGGRDGDACTRFARPRHGRREGEGGAGELDRLAAQPADAEQPEPPRVQKRPGRPHGVDERADRSAKTRARTRVRVCLSRASAPTKD